MKKIEVRIVKSRKGKIVKHENNNNKNVLVSHSNFFPSSIRLFGLFSPSFHSFFGHFICAYGKNHTIYVLAISYSTFYPLQNRFDVGKIPFQCVRHTFTNQKLTVMYNTSIVMDEKSS